VFRNLTKNLEYSPATEKNPFLTNMFKIVANL